MLQFWLRALLVTSWAFNAFPELPGAPSCPFCFLWLWGAWLVPLSPGSACPPSSVTRHGPGQSAGGALGSAVPRIPAPAWQSWEGADPQHPWWGWGVGGLGVCRGFWSPAAMGAAGKRASSQALQPLLVLRLFLLQPCEPCSCARLPGINHSPLPLCPSCNQPRGFLSAASGWRGEQGYLRGKEPASFCSVSQRQWSSVSLPQCEGESCLLGRGAGWRGG